MMNRRNAMSRVAMMIGAAISSPTLMAMEKMGKVKSSFSGNFMLTDAQRSIVAEVAEHIIPKTSTPGAKDVGVPAFIELILKDCYYPLEHTSFLAGVNQLDGLNFLSKSSADQVGILKKMEADTNEEMKARNVKQVKVGDNVDSEAMEKATKGVPFWRLMKELTLLGYFTSEEGVTKSFVYEPIPGKFMATKLKPGQKAFAYL
jgi:hypothetical protein